jgi:hypothetical protein
MAVKVSASQHSLSKYYPEVQSQDFKLVLQRHRGDDSRIGIVEDMKTVESAHRAMCQLLGIRNENKKRLFESIFFSDNRFDRFMLEKKDGLIYEIRVIGKRANQEAISQPVLEQPRDKIQLTITQGKKKGLKEKHTCIISGEQLKSDGKKDNSFEIFKNKHQAIALLNAKSFRSLTMYSSSCGSIWRMEKIKSFAPKL